MPMAGPEMAWFGFGAALLLAARWQVLLFAAVKQPPEQNSINFLAVQSFHVIKSI